MQTNRTKWQIRKLGDVCNFIGGGTPSKSNKTYYQGNILWATVRDMNCDVLSDTEFKITEEALKNSTSNVIPKNSVIIASRVGLGKVCILEKDTAINQDLRAVIPKEAGMLSEKYLFWWFKTIANLIIRNGRGATVKGVNLPFLNKLEIPIPSLAEQSRIVSVLDKADALRRKRKEAMKLLDEYVQAVFLEMFGDPVTNPRGWPRRELAEISNAKGQNGFFAKKDQLSPNGTPIVWIGDIIDQEYVNFSNLRRVISSEKEKAKYTLIYGDALFCRSSLNTEGIGKCSIVPRLLPETTIFECHIIRVPLNLELVLPEFFRDFAKTAYYRHQIMKNANTATMTTIAQDGVMKTEVLVPPMDMQMKYVQACASVGQLKSSMKQQVRELDNQFNALIQKSFAVT